ncbi:hypothetical protein [Buttiauxella sp. A111]|uniref:hypothetical protein n=1 Tax=Buttiauxella sp. A111 TaxID=2563088 RepID=UPI0010EF5797|nr:hypothetical protein [Buttiauxella sp. A111]GDX06344.1 hypothetical protein BSPA111_25530 [Buttiauxella sp. A111]
MPTVEELWKMLAAAHEAGNTEDAKAIAAWIKEIESAPKFKPLPKETGMVEDFSDGFDKSLYTAIDTGANHLKSGFSWLGNQFGIGDGTYEPSRLADGVKTRNSLAFKAGELTGDLAPALAGGVGASRLAAPVVRKIGNKYGMWAADGVASSLGAQLADTGEISLTQTGVDAGLNVGLNAMIPKWAAAIARKMRGADDGQLDLAAANVEGFTPSYGMKTKNKFALTRERALEGTAMGGGTMRRFNDANQEALQKFHDNLVKAVGARADATPQETGASIREAWENFLKEGRDAGTRNYQDVYRAAGNFRIQMPQVREAIHELTRVARDNKAMAKMLVAPELRSVSKMLNEQAKDGMTLEGAIGAKMAIDNMLIDLGMGLKKADEQQLLRLRSAIDGDIRQQLNDRAAFGVYARYNKATEEWAKFAQNEKGLSRLFDTQGDGALYAAIFGKASANNIGGLGVDKLKLLLSLMPEGVRGKIKGEYILRAGRESAGTAGSEGAQFSAARFLTNWNKLEKDGIGELVGAGHSGDLADLALISDRMKMYYAAGNHSNSATHIMNNPRRFLDRSTVDMGKQIVSGLVFDRMAAKALTNPEFAAAAKRFLTSTATDPEYAQNVIRLLVVANQNPDLVDDIEALLGVDSSQ